MAADLFRLYPLPGHLPDNARGNQRDAEILGPLAAKVQPLFITIDPERDTPDVVGTFVDPFDARIIGLSGTPAQIAAIAKEYHVYYAKSAASAADGDS